MKDVGMDVHVKATVWCCLEETAEIVERSKLPTTADDLTVPEHAWKTGDPWFSAECSRVSSMSDNRDATGRDHAKVRPARLTAIMAGIPKPLAVGHGRDVVMIADLCAPTSG
jgi:hypothetical protein